MSDPPPEHVGDFGRAWRRRDLERGSGEARTAACLRCYVMHNRGSHPFWPWHVLSLVTLEELPGLPPPERQFPEATHELLVVALDPEKPPPTAPGMSCYWLTPVDIAEQFEATDERASELCDLAMEACLDGRLSPDQDWRASWHKAVTGTLDHWRRGVHP